MKPERMAGIVARWARFYSRSLPPAIAQRRIDEIAADVRDEIAQDRSAGISESRIARGIASRMIRGIAADAAWRRHQSTASPLSQKKNAVFRPLLRIALGVGVILSIPLTANLTSDEANWSVGDFAVAGVLLSVVGAVLELAVRRAGNLSTAIAIAVLGVAAGLFGQADDAPGMVLLGMLLLGSAAVLGVRSVLRSR